MSAGGGSKRLFRKIKDRSSEFYPDENDVRRQGSYIYEEFLNTQGTDVKVYTVGANYGHAEARKSPVVDGKVHRSDAGLEVRYPVILSPTEKEITQKITAAFRQTVCGYGNGVCIDVCMHGWIGKYIVVYANVYVCAYAVVWRSRMCKAYYMPMCYHGIVNSSSFYIMSSSLPPPSTSIDLTFFEHLARDLMYAT